VVTVQPWVPVFAWPKLAKNSNVGDWQRVALAPEHCSK